VSETVITDLVPLACRGVTLLTRVTDRHVIYEVWVGAAPLVGERLDARLAWSRVVTLVSSRSFRAGGPAFTYSAQVQERVARAYLAAAKGVQ